MNRVAKYYEFGDPLKVVKIEEEKSPVPKNNQVLLGMEAACLHLADVYRVTGVRDFSSPPPGIPGAEGVGKVIAIGDNINNINIGDRFLAPLSSGTCRDELIVDADKLIPAPANGDTFQLAMATVNPVTSWLLFYAFIKHKPDSWILQNGGNSACGRYVIQIAKTEGIKTVSAVRRLEVRDELEKIGADAIVKDSEELPNFVAEITNNADIKLGLDVAAGDGTGWIANSLGELGLIVNYGLMSGKDLIIPKETSLGKGIRFQGFMMSRTFNNLYTKEKEFEIREKVSNLIGTGKLTAKVAEVYSLDNIAEALDHANRRGSERDGKILVKMKYYN